MKCFSYLKTETIFYLGKLVSLETVFLGIFKVHF